MNTELRMPLKRQWFELTKSGVKTEDYRELNEYWAKRLLKKVHTPYGGYFSAMSDFVKGKYDFAEWRHYAGSPFETFDFNCMTLGYPSKDDTSRIIKLEHKGIEIRTGNPEWGAEPNKLYFVIKHGNIIQE
jgi:hypothetical protein